MMEEIDKVLQKRNKKETSTALAKLGCEIELNDVEVIIRSTRTILDVIGLEYEEEDNINKYNEKLIWN